MATTIKTPAAWGIRTKPPPLQLPPLLPSMRCCLTCPTAPDFHGKDLWAVLFDGTFPTSATV